MYVMAVYFDFSCMKIDGDETVDKVTNVILLGCVLANDLSHIKIFKQQAPIDRQFWFK